MILEIIFLTIFCLVGVVVAFWQLNLLVVAVLGAPTVYASDQAILDVLKLADIKKGNLIVDLGCGNAKSLIFASKRFGARGVGVELSLYCFLKSKFNVFLAHESKNIMIIWGDFRCAERYLKNADVVYLYLLESVLKKIEHWLFKSINYETGVVSLAFRFNNHTPTKTQATTNLGVDTKIRLYRKDIDKF